MMLFKKFWLKQRKKKILKFKKYSQQRCLNCHYPLSNFDRFCPRCGQVNSKKKLNLYNLISEFLSSIFAYDSRVQHTFKAIFTSPGKIGKEYIAGKRVKYVNPFRFFIFIAIIFFLFVSWILPYDDIYRTHQTPNIYNEEVGEKPNTASVDSTQQKNDNLKEKDSIGKKSKNDNIYQYLKKNGFKTFKQTREDLQLEDNISNWIKYKYLLSASEIEKQPANFIKYLIPKFPFFIFFFLPIFTLFSKLFYLRLNFTYTEHLVFNYYQQSVFLLIFFLDLLIVNFTNYDTAIASSIVFSVYHILAKKSFYQQGYFKTILKFLLLGSIYFLLFLIFISIFTALSLAFYR